MNIVIRTIGAILIVVGMCIFVLTPSKIRHSSYTDPYVRMITQVFEFRKPSAEDIRLAPEIEERWHGTLTGILETYAAKVSSEQRKNLIGVVMQLTGLSLLLVATGNRFRTETIKQKG
jgi:hypothetical protein